MNINELLQYACKEGNLKAVILIFKRSPDVDPWYTCPSDPLPAIVIACIEGYADILSVMLLFLVKRHHQTPGAESSLPLLSSTKEWRDCEGNTGMYHAITHNHIRIVAVQLYFDSLTSLDVTRCGMNAVGYAKLRNLPKIESYISAFIMKRLKQSKTEVCFSGSPSIAKYPTDEVSIDNALPIPNAACLRLPCVRPCCRVGNMSEHDRSNDADAHMSCVEIATFRMTVISMLLALFYTLVCCVHSWDMVSFALAQPYVRSSRWYDTLHGGAPYVLVALEIISLCSQGVAWLAMWLVHATHPGHIRATDNSPPSNCLYGLHHHHLYLHEQQDIESAGHHHNDYIHTIGNVEDNKDKYFEAIDVIIRSNGDYAASTFCCHLCHRLRPLRCGHSRYSHCCIPVFDHFCAFLASDIGRDNYGFFVILVADMACVAMPVFIALALLLLGSSYARINQLGAALHFDPMSLTLKQDLQMYLSGLANATTLNGTTTITSSQSIALLESLRAAVGKWCFQAVCAMALSVFILWSFFVWLGMLVIFFFHLHIINCGMTSIEYSNLTAANANRTTSTLFPYIIEGKTIFSRVGFMCNLFDRLFPIIKQDFYDVSVAINAVRDTEIESTVQRGMIRGWRACCNAALASKCGCLVRKIFLSKRGGE